MESSERCRKEGGGLSWPAPEPFRADCLRKNCFNSLTSAARKDQDLSLNLYSQFLAVIQIINKKPTTQNLVPPSPFAPSPHSQLWAQGGRQGVANATGEEMKTGSEGKPQKKEK